MFKLGLIRQNLSARSVGRDVRLLESVPSTNSVLRDLAKAGAPEGTVVIADGQTAGHGRLGKSWFSPPGVNLYASVLFRPPIPLREVPGFSFIASLALGDAIAAEGLAPAIKWPNDVLVDRKKVAGTLVECASSGTQVDYVILGVGVNLNVTSAALHAALGDAARAAGSLAEAAGHEIDRNAFAAGFLNFLDQWAAIFAARGPAPVLLAWKDRDILTGRRVQVRGTGEAYDGRVLGVDREGYLVLREPRGARRRVLTGEIRLAD
jgi:BirA family biotin operon repressor/biotin-[acetyl-CoA-carboxylase] ligase